MDYLSNVVEHSFALEPARIVRSWMAPPLGDVPHVPATFAAEVHDVAGDHYSRTRGPTHESHDCRS